MRLTCATRASGPSPASAVAWAVSGLAILLLATTTMPRSHAAILHEDFATDPFARGWTLHGDSSLFAWDPDGMRLRATWDSTRTNSYFLIPLRMILTRADPIRFAFTLNLEEARTQSSDGTFELAIGLLRMADALGPPRFRGAGVNPKLGARNIIEFDYFPASPTITPTLSAVAVGTNNVRWSVLNLFPHELSTGTSFRIELTLDPANQRVTLSVTHGSETVAAGASFLDPLFGDLRVDAFSVTSYSGDHQPERYGGQILARGWIDDIEVEFPDPPSTRLVLQRGASGARIRAEGPLDWRPRLERSTDVKVWGAVTNDALIVSGAWQWLEPTTEVPWALYRVAWDRP